MKGREILWVQVPQLGVNDDSVTVLKWLVEDESPVRPGQPICEVENSKASYQVESEAEGYLFRMVEVGAQINIRDPLALICTDLERGRKERKNRMPAAVLQESPAAGSAVRATKKAERRARELGIDLAEVPHTGFVIQEEDVEAFARSRISEALETGSSVVACTPGRIPLVIYGAGRGGLTVAETLALLGGPYEVVGFLDDGPQRPERLMGVPVLPGAFLADLKRRGIASLACAISVAQARLRILRECEQLGIEVIPVRHPHAVIAPSAKIGRGTYVKAGAVIETSSVVGDVCIIDNGAIVPHDNHLGDAVHLAPGAVLGSSVTIGEGSIIGIGAAVATGTQIGRYCIVSPGAAVCRDIPDFSIVEGVPARVVGSRQMR